MSETLDLTSFVRPELRALKAYHLDLSPIRHKLDQNEVPRDLPRRIKERVAREWLETDWARYPDFHADALRQDIGRLHDWPWEGVLAGNGANELVSVALNALVAPGTEVLGTQPSFSLFGPFVLKSGGVPRFLPAGPDLQLPVDALQAEVERDPRRPVLLCTPNNPTGDALPVERVAALLDRLEAPLLLDNAYGEFCQYDYRPLLRRYPHLMVFRTFSKAWSLAGMRLGYVLAAPELVAEFIKVKLPYNLPHASILAARAALAERAESERRVRWILGRRPQFVAMLQEAGFEVFPTEANFVLIRLGSPEKARSLAASLEERGIRVRDVGSHPALAGCLRVSVGDGAALRDMRRALQEIREEERG